MVSDTVYLDSDSLLSKYGFGDGDMLDDIVWDWWDARNSEWGSSPPFTQHAVLVAVVKRHLLPALPEQVDTFAIGTCHNPIRVDKVNGERISHAGAGGSYPWAVEGVTITHADIHAVCEELLATSQRVVADEVVMGMLDEWGCDYVANPDGTINHNATFLASFDAIQSTAD